jgi:hypothetical protein
MLGGADAPGSKHCELGRRVEPAVANALPSLLLLFSLIDPSIAFLNSSSSTAKSSFSMLRRLELVLLSRSPIAGGRAYDPSGGDAKSRVERDSDPEFATSDGDALSGKRIEPVLCRRWRPKEHRPLMRFPCLPPRFARHHCLTALSLRPLSLRAISAHLWPISLTILSICSPSSGVNGSSFKAGFRF